jgi:hypothetical protein
MLFPPVMKTVQKFSNLMTLSISPVVKLSYTP